MRWLFFGGSVPATISYTALYTAYDARTIYTSAGHNIGTASADRKVIVGISTRDADGRTLSSVTIGGIAATIIIQQQGSGSVNLAAIAIADVPTGTTADIVAAFSGNVGQGVGISAWATTGLSSSTATDTAASTADPGDLTIDVASGGVIVAVGVDNNDAPNATWSNLTEKYDSLIGATGYTVTGASDAFASGQSALAVSVDWAAPAASVAVAAAFR